MSHHDIDPNDWDDYHSPKTAEQTKPVLVRPPSPLGLALPEWKVDVTSSMRRQSPTFRWRGGAKDRKEAKALARPAATIAWKALAFAAGQPGAKEIPSMAHDNARCNKEFGIRADGTRGRRSPFAKNESWELTSSYITHLRALRAYEDVPGWTRISDGLIRESLRTVAATDPIATVAREMGLDVTARITTEAGADIQAGLSIGMRPDQRVSAVVLPTRAATNRMLMALGVMASYRPHHYVHASFTTKLGRDEDVQFPNALKDLCQAIGADDLTADLAKSQAEEQSATWISQGKGDIDPQPSPSRQTGFQRTLLLQSGPSETLSFRTTEIAVGIAIDLALPWSLRGPSLRVEPFCDGIDLLALTAGSGLSPDGRKALRDLARHLRRTGEDQMPCAVN